MLSESRQGLPGCSSVRSGQEPTRRVPEAWGHVFFFSFFFFFVNPKSHPFLLVTLAHGIRNSRRGVWCGETRVARWEWAGELG